MTETIPNVTPITPENCHLLSPSTLLLWSLNQIVAQGVESIGLGGACKYRGFEGRKCAAGFCIPDSDCTEELEGCGIESTFFEIFEREEFYNMKRPELAKVLKRFNNPQKIALFIAQLVHDIGGVPMARVVVQKKIPVNWFAEFVPAKSHNLRYKSLADFLLAIGCTETFIIAGELTNFDYKTFAENTK